MGKEAEVNGKKYGEESLITVKLNIKNLIIILGFIGSMFTGGYYLLKDDITSVKDEIKTTKNSLSVEIDQIRDEDLKVIYNQVNQIDGKVQVLVNGSGRRNWASNTESSSPRPQPTPAPVVVKPDTTNNTPELPDL